MAGSLIPMPANGASDWSDFVTQCVQQRRGYMGISISNIGNENEPKIQAVSIIEVNGSLYKFIAEEALTGWGAIGNNNDIYMKVVPSGASITAVFTTTAPTWSDTKRGYFDGNDRYFGWLHKDGSGNYLTKRYLPLNFESPIIFKKVVETGPWNMDTTTSINVAHGLTPANIIGLTGYIINDAETAHYPINTNEPAMILPVSEQLSFGVIILAADYIIVRRTVTGMFGGSLYDDGVMNRGIIIIDFIV